MSLYRQAILETAHCELYKRQNVKTVKNKQRESILLFFREGMVVVCFSITNQMLSPVICSLVYDQNK
jgi:hypothetical protein